MNRFLTLAVGALLLFANSAIAQTLGWSVSEAAGKVVVQDATGTHAARRGTIVPAGSTLSTGPGSRAVVVRGKDFVTVAASSRIRIPRSEQRRGKFDVLQEWGNAVFQIEKKAVPHFEVRTPYLAAVVKGTTFSITVTTEGASLQVVEGAVETSTSDGGARELVRPGIVASVMATDRFRLTVQGQETRHIDSPQRSQPTGPVTSGTGSGKAPALAAVPSSTGAGDSTSGAAETEFQAVSEQATPNSGATASATDADIVVLIQAVAAKPVDLNQATGGLVRGTSAVQLASLDRPNPPSPRPSESGPAVIGIPSSGTGAEVAADRPVRIVPDSATGMSGVGNQPNDGSPKPDMGAPGADRPGKDAPKPEKGGPDVLDKPGKDAGKPDKGGPDASGKPGKDDSKPDQGGPDAGKPDKGGPDASDKPGKDDSKPDQGGPVADQPGDAGKPDKGGPDASGKPGKDDSKPDQGGPVADQPGDAGKPDKGGPDASDKPGKDDSKPGQGGPVADQPGDAGKPDKGGSDGSGKPGKDDSKPDQGGPVADQPGDAGKPGKDLVTGPKDRPGRD